ncbi:type I 3-dehydroquinate dehydratase [Dethiosulfovibrio sp. F2B]|uniref:type I 3-dehydroquinate dehydratase n=1 Tax=Dethiosulfovibrio faecalis TaxID=2720018 RepID=UPI001F2977CA|nr:type I 3-dehydroquinate dehydratase [Dethiosulfovibrio faecalis]MCF4150936.1 type I 3-dehydroquinate dehydratase [Dethiosulfovibrio faecalis]
MMVRPLPGKPLKVRNALLGGEVPLVCVPLVGSTGEDVMAEVENLSSINPDIIELRIDAWDVVEDLDSSMDLLRRVRSAVGDLPIILTCRGHWEGGIKEVSESAKDGIYIGAISEKLVELVDKELSYGYEKLSEVKALAENAGIGLIVSYHDFDRTPSLSFIYSQLATQIRFGADVAKVALMPRSEEDVLKVFEATLAVRRDFPDVPLITMSMGALGQVSRLAGGLYGSDLTFAVGSAESAPGQIPVERMHGAFDLLYR